MVAYRTASQNPAAAGSRSQLRMIYHALNPHPALPPAPENSDPVLEAEQQEKDSVYRQLLAHGAMAVLLPTEDLDNVCLRTLVGDILADLLLGEIISEKVVEGWFIWERVAKLLADLNPATKNEDMELSQKNQLEKFGLLAGNGGSSSSKKNESSMSVLVWGLLQYCYLIYLTIRFVVTGLFRVASDPTIPVKSPKDGTPESNGDIVRLPVSRYRLFGMIAQLVDVSRRMPWLGGSLALIQHFLLAGPGRLGESDGILDR